jgi:hypothetical protein
MPVVRESAKFLEVWRRVVLYKFADIRVETAACIFMVKIETMASRSMKSFDNR